MDGGGDHHHEPATGIDLAAKLAAAKLDDARKDDAAAAEDATPPPARPHPRRRQHSAKKANRMPKKPPTTTIRTRTGGALDRVEWFVNGKLTSCHGGMGGSQRKDVRLANGEYAVKIQQWTANHYVGNGIRVTTNMGTVHDLEGGWAHHRGPKGTAFVAGPGNMIAGLKFTGPQLVGIVENESGVHSVARSY